MASCIFCDIIAGESPASVVYDDSTVIAILDINPVTSGHLLVIPRRHVAGIGDMDESTGMYLFLAATRLAAALRSSGVRCEAVNLFLADGEAAGQEVFHVHFHVFPRFKGDTFRIAADWSARPSRDELKRTAKRIRSAYEVLARRGPAGIAGRETGFSLPPEPRIPFRQARRGEPAPER